MALRIYRESSHHKVKLITGHAYKFSYQAAQNDYNPTVFVISIIKGTHPTSGKQWNLIQGINIAYLPRAVRKRFVDIWKKEMTTNRRPEFSWELIKRKYPQLTPYIRRYLLSPNYYVRNIEHIPPEDYDKEVVKGWFKDFSSTIFRKAGAFTKRLFTGKRR